MEMNRNRPWQDLPPEILQLIAQHLTSRLLVLRFRAVCRSWRSCCPLPPHNNLLSPLFPLRLRNSDYLTASTVYLIEPLPENLPESSSAKRKGWFATVDELNPGKLFLRYPLSRLSVDHYPRCFPKDLNLLDFRITEIANSYALSYADSVDKLGRYVNFWNKGDWYVDVEIDKVIVIPNLSFACHSVHVDYASHYSVAVLFESGSLSIFRLRDGGKETIVHDGKSFKLDDIANYKGRIYGVDRRGTVYAIDYESYEVVKIAAGPKAGGSGRRKRLVESDRDLYLVTMQGDGDVKSHKTTVGCKMSVKAYKLNEGLGKWMEVRSLGDKVFVVGVDCSFAFSTEMHARIDGNCVFAFHYSFRRYKKKIPFNQRCSRTTDMGMFHLIDGGSFEKLYHRSYGSLETTTEDKSILQDIFWPPPYWLVPGHRLGSSSTHPETEIECEAMAQIIGKGRKAGSGSNNSRNIIGPYKQKTTISWHFDPKPLGA